MATRHEQLREEERAARKRVRDLERARRVASDTRARQWREELRAVVRELRPKHRGCTCNLRGVRTKADLAKLGGGCTMPAFACPMLTAVRSRMKGGK